MAGERTLICKVEQPFGFTLIRLAYGQVPYPLCLATLNISP